MTTKNQSYSNASNGPDDDNIPVVQAVPVSAEGTYGNGPLNYPLPSAPLYNDICQTSSSYQQPSPPPQQHAVTPSPLAVTPNPPAQRLRNNDCCCLVCGSIGATIVLVCFCCCVIPVIIIVAVISSIGNNMSSVGYGD